MRQDEHLKGSFRLGLYANLRLPLHEELALEMLTKKYCFRIIIFILFAALLKYV
jgi:hypothetical protein